MGLFSFTDEEYRRAIDAIACQAGIGTPEAIGERIASDAFLASAWAIAVALAILIGVLIGGSHGK